MFLFMFFNLSRCGLRNTNTDWLACFSRKLEFFDIKDTVNNLISNLIQRSHGYFYLGH